MKDWKSEIDKRLDGSTLSIARRNEIVEELAEHLEDRWRELVAAGVPDDDAERVAWSEVDARTLARGLSVLDRAPSPPPSPGISGRGSLVADLVHDLRFAVRMLRKQRGFAAVVVVTLALGIGGTSAMFSIVNAVLLEPLPYPDADRLVRIHESKVNFATGSISYPNFLDWQRDNRSFASMALSRGTAYILTGMGDAERVTAQLVSATFFPTLGVTPSAGRTFTSDEDRIGGAPAAMVSGAFAARRFGSAANALSRTLTLDGAAYTIVGVVPASFNLRVGGFTPADVYVPVAQMRNPLITNRASGLGLHGIGRLKPGVTIDQARADLQRVTSNLAAAFPVANKGIGAAVFPLKQEVVGALRPLLVLLLAAMVFVLLIVCVNVSNLLLGRSAVRIREFAIRTALGADLSRIVRQLATESLLLALAGAVCGLVVAKWGTQAALTLLPSALPQQEAIAVDGRVLAFTFALSLVTALLFGLAPIRRASARDVAASLQASTRGAVGPAHRTQRVFVVVQMALAFVLLVGAGLMARSLAALWSVQPGFDAQGVLTFNTSLPPSAIGAPPDAIRARYRELANAWSAVPGVRAVSYTWGAFPLAGDDEVLFWLDNEARPSSPNDMKWAVRYVVGPDYLAAMRLALKRGRFLSNDDTERSRRVAVVDDALAAQFFGGVDAALGRSVQVDGVDDPVEIVGVVGHVKQWAMDHRDDAMLRPQMYLPFMQLSDAAMALAATGVSVVIRTDGSPEAAFDHVKRAAARTSRETVVYDPQSMKDIVASSFGTRRFAMLLLNVFSIAALVLAAMGIYAVMLYSVTERTREMGVRLALGARAADVVRLVIGEGAALTGIGVGIGTVASLGVTRLLGGMLFGVAPGDPVTLAGVLLVVGSVALTACWIPARRATRADPLIALRAE